MADDGLESDSGDRGRDRCTVKRSDLDGMSLGVAVAAAVAARRGAQVLELDPLSGVVDVDALEKIWGPLDASQCDTRTHVSFPYMGYEVSVTPEELRLEPIESGTACGGESHEVG